MGNPPLVLYLPYGTKPIVSSGSWLRTLRIVYQNPLKRKDVLPGLCLFSVYLGYKMSPKLEHYCFLPWWVVSITGMCKRDMFIWTGGIIRRLSGAVVRTRRLWSLADESRQDVPQP